MTDGSRSPVSLRQVLWVAAGVVCLTFLVVVASWLFSPRTSNGSGLAGTTSIQEGTVDKKTFTPEPPGPGRMQPQASAAPAQGYSESRPAPPEPPADKPSASQPPASSRSVRLQPVEPKPPSPPPQERTATGPAEHTKALRGLYGVQVGAFSSDANARQVQHRLQASGYSSSILEKNDVHKVVVTGFESRTAAGKAMEELRRKGFPKAFIVSLE